MNFWGLFFNNSDTAFKPSESMLIAQKTFMALYNYVPESRQAYLPEDIELWLFPAWDDPENAKTWPGDLPSLGDLYEAAEPVEIYQEFEMRRLRLSGEEGGQISQMVDRLPHEGEYTDGENTLRIMVKALLPYPYPDPDPRASFSPNLYVNNTPPPITLTCQPSDGLLAIPSP